MMSLIWRLLPWSGCGCGSNHQTSVVASRPWLELLHDMACRCVCVYVLPNKRLVAAFICAGHTRLCPTG